MRLNEVSFGDGIPVDGYGPGFWRVGGERIDGAALVSPAGAASWGGWDDIAALKGLADKIDLVFLGTGAEIAHPPAPVRDALQAAGIAFEVMASPAAARTYNVLLAEGRRVAVALMPLDAA